jgi:hypothetical protein
MSGSGDDKIVIVGECCEYGDGGLERNSEGEEKQTRVVRFDVW